MEDENKSANRAIMLLGIISLILFIIGATSCRSVKVVTEYKEIEVHDTVQRVDSVFQDRIHKEYVKGDTVKIIDSVFINNFQYIYKNVEVTKVDSVPYPVEVPVPGPVRNSRLAEFCIRYFWITASIFALLIALFVYRKLR